MNDLGLCCGFLPPERCNPVTSTNGTCSTKKKGWYSSTSFCALDKNRRNTLNPTYDGGRLAVGCPYDHPIGSCGVAREYKYGKSAGCAQYLLIYMQRDMTPAGYVGFGFISFQVSMWEGLSLGHQWRG